MFLEDARDEFSFAALKHKIPQVRCFYISNIYHQQYWELLHEQNVIFFLFIPRKEPITGHICTQILSEFKDLKDVTDVVKTIEITVGFLSTSGGDPEMSIGDYCRDVLLLNEGKSTPKNKKVFKKN